MTVVPAILALLGFVALVGFAFYVLADDIAPDYSEPDEDTEPAEGFEGCYGCLLAGQASDGFLALHLRRDHPLERAA